ncbi:tetratricopeptide repeat protein, partial [Allochromatium humboldtianum]
ITFAQNPATLAALRAGLRERVARSPLFDAQRFAKNLYQAFLSMWQQAQSLASDVLNDSCRQAADFSPEAHSAELVNLFNQGQYAECEALARQLTQRAPNYGFGWNVLGVLYKQLGRIEEALVAMEQAAVLLPEDAEVLNNYGATLQNLHRSQAAEPYLRRAIALKPDYVEAYNNLAATLHELDRYSEAEACLHQAIALRPSYPEAWYNLGNTLKQQGRLEEAEQSLLQALALRPNWPSAYTMLLFCLNYGQHQDARTRLSHARQYGDLLTRMAERPYKDWRCDAVPKRLRVGLASPDLRTHPVGYFLESVLADLGHTGIELVAYPTFPHEDALTQRLKAHFVGWHSLVGLSDEEAA